MHEIRLAACCRDEAAHAGIVARVRGAVVESRADLSQFCGPPDGCDAAILAGATDLAAVERFLSAKMHVLVVAEPCLSAESIASLSATARNSGVQFAIANPDRYLPSRQLIRKQLLALGEPGLVRIHRWHAGAATEVAELPDSLLRDIDTALWLMSRRPDLVFAAKSKSDGAGRFVQIHLGFSHGGMALLDYTNRLPPGDEYTSLSVIAASGAAYADDHQNRQLLYRGGLPEAVQTVERAGQLAAIAQEFVDALQEGRDLSASATTWRDVFAVAGAVVKSLASRQAVTLEVR